MLGIDPHGLMALDQQAEPLLVWGKTLRDGVKRCSFGNSQIKANSLKMGRAGDLGGTFSKFSDCKEDSGRTGPSDLPRSVNLLLYFRIK